MLSTTSMPTSSLRDRRGCRNELGAGRLMSAKPLTSAKPSAVHFFGEAGAGGAQNAAIGSGSNDLHSLAFTSAFACAAPSSCPRQSSTYPTRNSPQQMTSVRSAAETCLGTARLSSRIPMRLGSSFAARLAQVLGGAARRRARRRPPLLFDQQRATPSIPRAEAPQSTDA